METANGDAALPAAASGQEPDAEQAKAPQAPTAPDGVRADGRRRRIGVLLAVAAAVYALDVVSKAIVVATMTYGSPIRLLGPVLRLDYTRNGGAAFSLGGTGYTVVFSLIAVGVVTVILRLARKLFSVRWAIALGLLL